jgi:hypothetical protein
MRRMPSSCSPCAVSAKPGHCRLGPVKRLGQSGDCAVLLCERVDAETIASLVDWRARNGAARLAIYSPRPSTLAEQLAAAGVEANCYSLLDAVMRGQVGGGANE